MEGAAADQAPSHPHDQARPAIRAARVVSGCLIFILETLVKAAFILFWFNLFSVIRLQAGF